MHSMIQLTPDANVFLSKFYQFDNCFAIHGHMTIEVGVAINFHGLLPFLKFESIR